MRRFLVGAALAAMVSFVPVSAQSDPSPPAATGEGWRNTVAVYFLGAGMSGHETVKGLEAQVDVSASEILQNLEAGGMLAWRGETKRWAITFNAMFVGVGATKEGPHNTKSDVDVDQAMAELDGSWRFSDRFEVLFGARSSWLDSRVEVDQPLLGTAERQGSKAWVDPVVGARVTVPLGRKWSFSGRGDIGGFGLASDLTWQAVAHFDWQASKVVGMTMGFQAIYADYQEGSGSDLFHYDVTTAGPFLGMILSF
jgi:opacity protein-like surface antigen